MHARVIVLAGPSGDGRSRLAERLGLPVLRLDDFYKDGGDPSLPRITDPLVTFWRRLTRDLGEHCKPPLVLLRRGVALLLDQRRVVAHAEATGCRVATPDQAYDEIRALL